MKLTRTAAGRGLGLDRGHLLPYLASPTERHYNLTDAQVDVSGIGAILDSVDEDWREHLSRTPD